MIPNDEEVKDLIIIILFCATVLLASFASTLIAQIPVQKCVKWNQNKCEIESIIWQDSRWLRVE